MVAKISTLMDSTVIGIGGSFAMIITPDGTYRFRMECFDQALTLEDFLRIFCEKSEKEAGHRFKRNECLVILESIRAMVQACGERAVEYIQRVYYDFCTTVELCSRKK
jgi:hypothetical protein